MLGKKERVRDNERQNCMVWHHFETQLNKQFVGIKLTLRELVASSAQLGGVLFQTSSPRGIRNYAGNPFSVYQPGPSAPNIRTPPARLERIGDLEKGSGRKGPLGLPDRTWVNIYPCNCDREVGLCPQHAFKEGSIPTRRIDHERRLHMLQTTEKLGRNPIRQQLRCVHSPQALPNHGLFILSAPNSTIQRGESQAKVHWPEYTLSTVGRVPN